MTRLTPLMSLCLLGACASEEATVLVRGDAGQVSRTVADDDAGEPSRARAVRPPEEDDDQVVVYATAEIDADGAFLLEIPADAEPLVVQVVDDSGDRIAATALGAPASTEALTDFGAEASVEAEAWLACGGRVPLLVAEQRLDAEVAAAVDAGGSADGDVRALADVVVEAWGAEQAALREEGAARTDELDAEGRSRVEAVVATTARLQAEARIGRDPLLEAVIREADRREARASGEASGSVLVALDAWSSARAATDAAAGALEAALGTAASTEERAEAWVSWESALVGATELDLRASVLATVMPDVAGDDLRRMLDARADAEARLDTDLAAAAELSGEARARAIVLAHERAREALQLAADELEGRTAAEVEASWALSFEAIAHGR